MPQILLQNQICCKTYLGNSTAEIKCAERSLISAVLTKRHWYSIIVAVWRHVSCIVNTDPVYGLLPGGIRPSPEAMQVHIQLDRQEHIWMILVFKSQTVHGEKTHVKMLPVNCQPSKYAIHVLKQPSRQLNWFTPWWQFNNSGLILGLRQANERRQYFAATSLIGLMQG